MNPSNTLDAFIGAISTFIVGAPAIVHAVVAEVGIPTPDWVGSLTQVSAFGLVAWIVFFMFTKWLPSLQAAAAEQLKEQRDAHTIALQAIADAHKQAITVLTSQFGESLKSQRQDLLEIMEARSDAGTLRSAPTR
jgi:hypothetical protein